jgi:hypothetical protein
LRLRIALRIADREPAKAKQVLADIKAEGGAYISSNAETAQFTYLDSPNQNPISNLFDTRDDYRISKTIVDKLLRLNDPRLPVYASKTQGCHAANLCRYTQRFAVAMPATWALPKHQNRAAYFLAPHAPAVIISYAEVLFDRAEAAARGFIAPKMQQTFTSRR